jgi:CHAD domain-containing protein
MVLREDLLEALKVRWKDYRRALKRCQKRASEPKVHALRVEARRLLSTLEVLGSLVAHARILKACKKLKEQLDSFDELRDTHVQLIYVREILQQFPELKPIYRRLKRREGKLVKPAAKSARRCRLGALERAVKKTKLQLKAAFAAPTVRHRSRERIASVLRSAFEQVVQLRERINPRDAATIHRTRIAFKKYRYMIELLEPVLPWAKPTQSLAMNEYQTMMGAIQDAEVMMATLKAMAKTKKFRGISFDRVEEFLKERHGRLVENYLERANDLFSFWPAASSPLAMRFPPEKAFAPLRDQ